MTCSLASQEIRFEVEFPSQSLFLLYFVIKFLVQTVRCKYNVPEVPGDLARLNSTLALRPSRSSDGCRESLRADLRSLLDGAQRPIGARRAPFEGLEEEWDKEWETVASVVKRVLQARLHVMQLFWPFLFLHTNDYNSLDA